METCPAFFLGLAELLIFAPMREFPWGHQRRFNAYSNYFKKQFGQRIQKLSVNAGFTCPNRDGTVARGGCTYCNNDAFSPSYCVAESSVTEQLKKGIDFHKDRYNASRFLAYFQNFSNTYASLDDLKNIYEEALQFPEVEGLVIGTRPDVIDEEKLAYFAELSQNKYVIIEYGIESCYNQTLERINRGHTLEQTRKAIEQTADYGVKVGGHLMFGLPGETKQMMLDEVDILNSLPLNNIKFHQLQIMKNTIMGREYKENPGHFRFFELDEYIDFVIDVTEKLNPAFVIERFSGEAPPWHTLSPRWGLRTPDVMNLIEQRMVDRDTWQGKYFKIS